MTPDPPEERHPRVPEFEGSACEVLVGQDDPEWVPGIVAAVYQPAPDAAPDAKRAVVETEADAVVDVNPASDAFEVILS